MDELMAFMWVLNLAWTGYITLTDRKVYLMPLANTVAWTWLICLRIGGPG